MLALLPRDLSSVRFSRGQIPATKDGLLDSHSPVGAHPSVDVVTCMNSLTHTSNHPRPQPHVQTITINQESEHVQRMTRTFVLLACLFLFEHAVVVGDGCFPVLACLLL